MSGLHRVHARQTGSGYRSLLLALALLLCSPLPAHANPLVDLQDKGHLYVKTYTQPQEDIVPAQKVRLIIEVGTDTWFAGGTRISVPEVPGLIILQNEQFASNATQSINGATWVVQRWSLDVFAQRAGNYAIPPIRLSVKVNAGSAGDVQGELLAPAIDLAVSLPPPLEALQTQDTPWVAAPDLRITQQFDRSVDNVQVGDAIAWTVTFEAEDVMAMMLPQANTATFDGMATYREPPALENRNNRGTLQASRTQRFSLVAEQPGDYTLPEQRFAWWDTRNGELRSLTLPAQTITVAGARPAADSADGPAFTTRTLIVVVGGAVGLFALLYLLWLMRLLPWDRITAFCVQCYRWLQDLRRPALAPSLNPRKD
ncbi:MAG: BatD family protein [Gammaproteobacteria bacterium]|nr:BatD family protein [Gammaproteobacteria bacterium]